jgi:hypothetical protein
VSLHKRLERLEAAADATMGPPQMSRAMERLLHVIENGRREIEGRELLPDLPRTEQDREGDRRFLEETIPAYRESRGWQTEEARAVLDHWQRHTEERLRGD